MRKGENRVRRLAEWRPEYAIGVDEIDDQHQELFELVNELWLVVGDGSPPSRVAAVIERLESYTLKHFRAEEELMRIAGYPGCAEHEKAHAKFIAYIAAEKARFNAGTTPGSEMLVFLNNWLVNHIRVDDHAAADVYLDRLPPKSWFHRIFGTFG